MSINLTKAELEYYATAKPRTSEIPGYFTDDGKLVLGPFSECAATPPEFRDLLISIARSARPAERIAA